MRLAVRSALATLVLGPLLGGVAVAAEDGLVRITPEAEPDTSALVLLTDKDLVGAAAFGVQVTNPATGEVETVQLSPTGSAGQFAGHLTLTSAASASGDGTLGAAAGDSYEVSYLDLLDASGMSAPRTAMGMVVSSTGMAGAGGAHDVDDPALTPFVSAMFGVPVNTVYTTDPSNTMTFSFEGTTGSPYLLNFPGFFGVSDGVVYNAGPATGDTLEGRYRYTFAESVEEMSFVISCVTNDSGGEEFANIVTNDPNATFSFVDNPDGLVSRALPGTTFDPATGILSAQSGTNCGQSVVTVTGSFREVYLTANSVTGNGQGFWVDTAYVTEPAPVDVTPIPTVTSQMTADSTPVVTGTYDETDFTALTVQIVDAGGMVLQTYTDGDGNLSVDGNGNWTLNISPALADGTYSVTATQEDPQGNFGVDTTTNELIIDTPPDATLLTVNGQQVCSTAPTLTGTFDEAAFDANPGTIVRISVGAASFDFPTDAGTSEPMPGVWQVDLSAGPTVFMDGTYDVTVTQIEPGGQMAADSSIDELVIDCTGAPVPVVDTLVSNIASPTLTGSYDPTETAELLVSVNGMTYSSLANPTVVVLDPATGTWELILSVAPMALAEGVYDVTATAVNALGVSSVDTTMQELTIDFLPSAPAVDPALYAVDQPVITGTYPTLQAFGALEVTVNGTTYSTADMNSPLTVDPAAGTWSLDLTQTAQTLPDATYDVDAVIVDPQGNRAPDTTMAEITVDVLPMIPTVTSLQTVQLDPTLSGTYDVAQTATFTLTVGMHTVSSGDPGLTLNPNGTWTFDLAAAGLTLAPGTYDVSVTTADPQTNSVVDATLDELEIVLVLLPAPTVDDELSEDGLPILTGTAPVGDANYDRLSVTVNNVTYVEGTDPELVVDASGTWTLDLTGLAVPFTTGFFEVDAVVLDTFGNTVSDTSMDELEVVLDSDGDGISTVDELILGTDPTDPDSDDDGLTDGQEQLGADGILGTADDAQTNPLDSDSDEDGLDDGDEVFGLDGMPGSGDETDPTQLDTDGDGITDGVELGVDMLVPGGTSLGGVPFEGSDPSTQLDQDPSMKTDPNDRDSDDDGLIDGAEDINADGEWVATLGGTGTAGTGETDPNNPDTDGDTLTDGEEDMAGSSPVDTDTDDGGVDDGTEVANNMNPIDPSDDVADLDDDQDGLTNAEEAQLGTDPTDSDSDDDGLTDGEEQLGADGILGTMDDAVTDPLDSDSDEDGLDDGDEVFGLDGLPGTGDETDPTLEDTDADGVNDGVESGVDTLVPGGTSLGGIAFEGTDTDTLLDQDPSTTTDPNNPDTDDDGLIDGVEDENGDGEWTAVLGGTGTDGVGETDPNNPDTDGDSLDDGLEVQGIGSNALDTDTDDGGVDDGTERANGTDVFNAEDDLGDPGDLDDDNDGLTNAEEAQLGTDPDNADSDDDGLLDGEEVNQTQTDPLIADTDGGGVNDGDEVAAGTDPLDGDDDDGLGGGGEGGYRGGPCSTGPTGTLPAFFGLLMALGLRRRR